jgi:hypothetical protein
MTSATLVDPCSECSALFGMGFRTLEPAPDVTCSLSVRLFASFFYLRKTRRDKREEIKNTEGNKEIGPNRPNRPNKMTVSLASRGFRCSDDLPNTSEHGPNIFPTTPPWVEIGR